MAATSPRNERRTDSLSKSRIVEVAIDILDADGEGALTFRALSKRLATGSGAIYWHVANKDELLAAATDSVVARILTGSADDTDPKERVRSLALEVFDAIDAHPWVGSQLTRDPRRSAMAQIFEGVGSQIQALGVADAVLFDAASAVMNYILGVAGQNAANARLHHEESDRTTVLGAVAERWMNLDPEEFPFLRTIAATMSNHDDRDQFLAGIDFILAGIAPTR